jgi:hypothetical protein
MNGTVLLMYRGCVVSGGGCKDEVSESILMRLGISNV